MQAATIDENAVYRSTPAPRRAVYSWAFYDFGTTVFSLMIVSLHFPLWVVDDMGGTDAHFTLAVSLSMGLMLLAAPVLGALSDSAPRRMPFLVVSSAICIALTLFLGSGGLIASLALFVVANLAFQVGLLFYDTLLPAVSTAENRGRIGGMGISIGYVGSIVAILMALAVIAIGGTEARVWVFRFAAVLFLLAAIPCVLFVPEPVRRVRRRPIAQGVREAIGTARGAIASLRHEKDLRNFLGSHILYADAANTTIAVMGIYATNEVGFSDTQAQIVLLFGVLGAIAGGLVFGRLVDRFGPRDTLQGVLAIWVVALTAVACIAWLDLPVALFWGAALLIGVALGGMWTADRPMMLQLTPADRLGEYWGLYSMVGRFAAMIGPLLWAIIVTGLGLGRPLAVASLAVFVVGSMVLLARVRDVRPEASVAVA